MSLPVSLNNTYIVEKGLEMDHSDSLDGWEFVESTLLPNINYVQGEDTAPFVLWFYSGSIHPISMNLFRIRTSSLSNVSVKDSRKLVENHSSTFDSKSFSVQNEHIEVHFDDG